jgi:glycosyltransferase involved in cell wall biosynthesis
VSDRRVALDISSAKLGRMGVSVYILRLFEALAPILGERLVPIASRFARPVLGARRSITERFATLMRDVWWHQVGVTLAARYRRCALLHLPAGLGPIRGSFPKVLTVHDAMPVRFPAMFRPWYRKYAAVVMPRVAQAARAVITGSQAAKQEIVEWLRVPPERVTVVPYGVDPVFGPLPPEHDRVAAVRTRYNLPRQFALTVGSVEPRKNLPRLIEAVSILRARPGTSDIRLVHAGAEGWRPEEARAAVKTHGLDGAVRFLGYVPVDELRVLYATARVFVYPSLWEGFGLPPLEAMACGCPVLTSRVSALPEVAGGAAVLVDPTSVDELAAGIATLWCDDSLRDENIQRGLERAREFTWKRAAEETAIVYDKALS